jgi:outer membrane lipoprotein-sorting protein
LSNRKHRFCPALLLALMLPLAAFAQSLDQAASQAASQYDAKVLSAHTEQDGNQKVHVIKLLTKDGVVKTVRIPVRSKQT